MVNTGSGHKIYSYKGRDYLVPAGLSHRATVNYVLELRSGEQGTGAQVHDDAASSDDESSSHKISSDDYGWSASWDYYWHDRLMGDD